jgi:hypothetical protein
MNEPTELYKYVYDFSFQHGNILRVRINICKKVKVPCNRLESPEEEGGTGTALHSLDIGTRRRWVASTTPRPLYPRERPGTHCIGDWVGPRAGLDWCEKSRPYRDSIPGSFRP